MNLIAHGSFANNVSHENISCWLQLLGIFLFLAVVAYVYCRLKTSALHLKSKRKFGRKLEILETKPLGNRQFLLVVSYESNKFLLGVHPNGMQFLSKLSNEKKLPSHD